MAGSVINFVASLKQDIPAAPSGTISIPKDPLSINNIQPYAYLPMIDPKPSQSFAVWRGNLKKYHTLNGTLYGQNGQRLYQTDSNSTKENRNYPFAVNDQARDIWQKPHDRAIGIDAGGAKSQIDVPTGKSSGRKVFVEVITVTQPNNQRVSKIQEVSVNNGNLQGFDKLTGYSMLDMAYLLNYLGFPIATDNNAYQSLNDLQAAVKSVQPQPERVLGGVLHSLPVLASYKGVYEEVLFDTNNPAMPKAKRTAITSDEDKRDDNLLYGSMDGALHMVNAKDGKEQFSFIPRAMFDDERQRLGLKAGTINNKVGVPAFGVDAPWVVNPTYKVSEKGDGISADKMYAYGGLRMGGRGIYGLDISNKITPQLLFSIDNKTVNFERMGQVWSKPLVTHIRTGKTNRQVVIFGGGYDMCYEDPKFNLGATNNGIANTSSDCATKQQMQGNAVYVIDAKTGNLIASWSVSDNEHMKHSIVAEINGVDRDNDGAVDHLYVADLGGQIFRIDLGSGSSIKGSRSIHRIFNANAGINNPIPYRFYERPIVSFYNDNGGRFGLINVSTGDRSSPLSKHRTMDNPNRIYGIFDKDVAMTAFGQANFAFKSINLDNNSLQHIDTKKIANGSDSTVKDMIDNMRKDKHGWYYDMIRFSGFIDVPHLKAVGPGIVTGSIYYTSVYSPEYEYSRGGSCSAGIAGGTERQMYCLPWGICADPNTGKLGRKYGNSNAIVGKNGTLGFMKAGPGIQEFAMTTITGSEGKSSPLGSRTMVSHMTITEQKNSAIRTSQQGNGVVGSGLENSTNKSNINNGPGVDIATEQPKHDDIFRLSVQRWYDLQDAEKN